MKRGRKSRGFNSLEGDKEIDTFKKDQQKQNLGYSITDLPTPIFVSILLKLSVKRLLVCKCVCKNWCNIIMDPEFAKLHFAQSEAYPLIRSVTSKYISRTLYLVEPPELSSGFDLGYCSCNAFCNSRCDRHINMKLDSKLKLPLHNDEMVINWERDVNANLHSRGSVERKRCVKLRNKYHKFDVVNSCNGLLCLSGAFHNVPLAVCNPVTGEYINLPTPTVAEQRTKDFFDCGLGFSPKTNQYKVIRMFNRQARELINQPITDHKLYSGRAEIHELGTGSWKMIGCAPSSSANGWDNYGPGTPAYLNGALHWFLVQCSNNIVSFNFDSESFQSVLPPPLKYAKINLDMRWKISLGVLGGQLCICDCYNCEYSEVWTLEEYGIQGSWRKVFHCNTLTYGGRRLYCRYEPLSRLRNGAILLFDSANNAVLYCDPKNEQVKCLKLQGIKSEFKAFAHIPSFISLKDAVMGDNLSVLNIARYPEIKLEGETKSLRLVEEIADMGFKFH
ncbi:hypothetical protein U1Q18_015558 [Sarracenia purpurea var. burkii]